MTVLCLILVFGMTANRLRTTLHEKEGLRNFVEVGQLDPFIFNCVTAKFKVHDDLVSVTEICFAFLSMV